MMKKFKFLGALFFGLIGLVSFGYCGQFFITKGSSSYLSIAGGGDYQMSSGYCYAFTNSSCNSRFSVLDLNGNTIANGSSDYTSNSRICVNGDLILHNGYNYACDVYYYTINDFSYCDTCSPQYTSEECQQEYSLMPITSCNSEYCGLNGLCPEYTGSTMSELYINGINHLGAPIINISIPLEQAWDYEYTGDVMNINLSGENNVDYEYIDNIIRTQNSKPNDTDFNNIVSGLIPLFVPGLVLILFILFIFRFIKKIF